MRLLLLISLIFIYIQSTSQCSDAIVADASFEEGTFPSDDYPHVEGIWYRSDGTFLNENDGFHLNNSGCSNGGGAFQYVSVEPSTTYHLSCYVLNGTSDEYPSISINWSYDPIAPKSDDWSLVSQEFYSGSDTVVIIGFYSDQACFDLFSVSCEPLVSTDNTLENTRPYSIFPTISPERFAIETSTPCKVEILNLNGQIVEQLETSTGFDYLGSSLSASTYIVRIFSDGKYYFDKIIKL